MEVRGPFRGFIYAELKGFNVGQELRKCGVSSNISYFAWVKGPWSGLMGKVYKGGGVRRRSVVLPVRINPLAIYKKMFVFLLIFN